MIYLIITLFLFPLQGLDYSTHIAPIIYENCTSCHRENQIGSFLSLTSYEEVFINQDLIAYAISGDDESRHGDPTMPPWPPDRSYSTLLDEMYLTKVSKIISIELNQQKVVFED